MVSGVRLFEPPLNSNRPLSAPPVIAMRVMAPPGSSSTTVTVPTAVSFSATLNAAGVVNSGAPTDMTVIWKSVCELAGGVWSSLAVTVTVTP